VSSWVTSEEIILTCFKARFKWRQLLTWEMRHVRRVKPELGVQELSVPRLAPLYGATQAALDSGQSAAVCTVTAVVSTATVSRPCYHGNNHRLGPVTMRCEGLCHHIHCVWVCLTAFQSKHHICITTMSDQSNQLEMWNAGGFENQLPIFHIVHCSG